MDLYGDGIVDKPVPGHIFVEQPLIKCCAAASQCAQPGVHPERELPLVC